MKKLVTSIVLLCLVLTAFSQITEKRNVSGFTAIDASSFFYIAVTKGTTESLSITADKELMPYIVSEVSNGTLRLYIKDDFKKVSREDRTTKPEVQISLKNLTKVKLSGACKLESASTFEPVDFKGDLSGACNLKLNLHASNKVDVESSGASKVDMIIAAREAEFDASGSCKMNLQLQATKVSFDLSGASKITAAGNCDNVVFETSGASNISAFDLFAKRVNVDLSGSSKVEINARENLSVEASGASAVYYKGSPRFDSIETSGAAKIKSAN